MDQATSNGPSQADSEKVVQTIEGYIADLQSEKSLYMNRCKPIHEAIKDTIEEAVKTKGFDKKALKITVKQRELLKKMEKLENELDEVTQHALDRLQMQLGTFADSPLGKAAMDAERAASEDNKAEAAKPRRGRKPKRDPLGELMNDNQAPADGAEDAAESA